MTADDRFLERLQAAIGRWPLPADARFAVAFSGGLDSTVLLASLARLGLAPRALHVNHGLAAAADDWQRHCEAAAARLGADFAVARVTIEPGRIGTEAAARDARYAALAQLLRPAEVLLTAHHADDQLETLLLRLVRGAGVRGLRGVLPFAEFAPGFLGRPLLELTRAELAAAAERFGLEWLDDPANRDLRHDRNLLRLRVLPPLLARWPAAPKLAERTAAQMRDAEAILTEAAEQDAAHVGDLRRLDIDALAALPPTRQRNLLRHALRTLGLPVPGFAQLERVRASALAHRTGARTRLAWPGAEARVYRAQLYLLAPLPEGSGATYSAPVSASRPWRGPEGELGFAATPSRDGLPDSWVEAGLTLRFRAGGERFRPAGGRHSVSLKHWLQEHGIVPWMRERIPLLYRGEELVAIADLAVAEAARAASAEARCRVVWTAHPPVV